MTSLAVARRNIEQRHALDALGMIAREPMGDPRAAVVTGDGEAFEAERSHRIS
jgi:hypothetical protein